MTLQHVGIILDARSLYNALLLSCDIERWIRPLVDFNASCS